MTRTGFDIRHTGDDSFHEIAFPLRGLEFEERLDHRDPTTVAGKKDRATSLVEPADDSDRIHLPHTALSS